jgi:hypothetical protein
MGRQQEEDEVPGSAHPETRGLELAETSVEPVWLVWRRGYETMLLVSTLWVLFYTCLTCFLFSLFDMSTA